MENLKLEPFIEDTEDLCNLKQEIVDSIINLGDPIAVFTVPLCKHTFTKTVLKHEGLRMHYGALVIYNEDNKLDQGKFAVFLVNNAAKIKDNKSTDTEFVWTYNDFESAADKVNDLLSICTESYLSLQDLDYDSCFWAFLEGEYINSGCGGQEI